MHNVLTQIDSEALTKVLTPSYLFFSILFIFSYFFFSESTVETDFSGTTFTCAIIRDNSCIMANIGNHRFYDDALFVFVSDKLSLKS